MSQCSNPVCNGDGFGVPPQPCHVCNRCLYCGSDYQEPHTCYGAKGATGEPGYNPDVIRGPLHGGILVEDIHPHFNPRLYEFQAADIQRCVDIGLTETEGKLITLQCMKADIPLETFLAAMEVKVLDGKRCLVNSGLTGTDILYLKSPEESDRIIDLELSNLIEYSGLKADLQAAGWDRPARIGMTMAAAHAALLGESLRGLDAAMECPPSTETSKGRTQPVRPKKEKFSHKIEEKFRLARVAKLQEKQAKKARKILSRYKVD
jgi:hypothetical protein